MDYRSIAEEIYKKVGGSENLISAAHCATRLRLVLVDSDRCDVQGVEEIDSVKGVFSASGQMQIILGTGMVDKVYDEFIAISGLEATSKEEVKRAATVKQNPFQRAVKTLGDIFIPIIPALVASGVLMGIMEALTFMVNNGFLRMDTDNSVFTFAGLIANTAYTFLPILIAYSAAGTFGGNPYLGTVMGMLMIHPELQNAWTVATEGVQRTQSVWFGLYSIDMVGYQGHVIPVIIAVWVMCFLEKRLHKIVPAMLDLFITPLVSIFVTGYLTYSIIGPVFVGIENAIIDGVQFLLTLPYGIGSLIMGGLYSLTVVAGVHHMYTIIDVGQLAKYGLTYWLPLASAANIAQGAAALAVGLKSKNTKTRAVAVPSALSCFMGITEPAIFGVNLRTVRPFICGAIGGACGALYSSLVGLGASGTGVTGIFGLLLTLHAPLQYVIMFLISAGVAFSATWFFGGKEENVGKESRSGAVRAPVEGEVIPLEEIPDPTFAAGILGQGVGIRPQGDEVVAPFDGTIASVTCTGHAVGITSAEGIQLLIHVGIDTVSMEGDGFLCHVQEGQFVRAGEKLITFDREKIRQAGHSDCVVVLVINASEYEHLRVRTGVCRYEDSIITV